VGAPHAVLCQSIDVWHFKLLLSKTGEIAIPEIVGDDEYYIGLLPGFSRKKQTKVRFLLPKIYAFALTLT
jgi:hypothetical protein